MGDVGIEETKAALRTEAHKRRAQLHPSLRLDAANDAVAHFLGHLPPGKGEVVAAYWPIRDELDIKHLIVRLMDAGQPVALPVVLGDEEPLELRLWQEGAPLYEAGFGTLAPEHGAPRVEPDVILMPLLGFDRHGTRLGYGGGYYDRTLAHLARRPRLVGFAFARQEIDHIPRDAHDVPLDAVVTELGVRHFEKAPLT
jgi:5-formyltetrahydrofolate cyclo-ligase